MSVCLKQIKRLSLQEKECKGRVKQKKKRGNTV